MEHTPGVGDDQSAGPAPLDEAAGAERVEVHHKHEPIHGWREFLKEVAIIVLGVLIAIGAEQLVQAAHQRHEESQAKSIIRNEIALSLGRLQSRMAIHDCVNRRIEEIQKILDIAASDATIVTPSWIGRPQYWSFLNSRWQAESQAGRAALIDGRRLSDYGIMYNRMQNLLDDMGVEQTDWARLRTLEHLRRLYADGALQFNVTLQDARYRNWRIALVTDQLFDMGNALRLRPVPNTVSADRSICLPITTTRAEGDRLSVWPVGEP